MKDWDLYLVTEEELSRGRSTLEVVKQAVAGGIDVVQLREKQMTSRQKYQLGRRLRQITAEAGIDLIVNDDLGLTQALDADGVHLGDDDLPITAAREVLGSEKIIGYSTSNLSEVQAAWVKGADYVGFGAIYKTSSKDVQTRRQGIGSERLKKVSQQVEIPIVAIGGLDETNIQQIKSAGADAVAMISALTQAEDIKRKVSDLKTKVTSG